MNNCLSDSVNLFRALRSYHDDAVKAYRAVAEIILRITQDGSACCFDKTLLLNELSTELDILIESRLDCCQTISGKLDEITGAIDDLSTVSYTAVFTRHTCAYRSGCGPMIGAVIVDDDDLYPEFSCQWTTFGCVIADASFVAVFKQHICAYSTEPV